MRINSNKKIHKMKRDPYQTLLKTAGILAIVVIVGFGIFFLCRSLIENEYKTKRRALERENIESEQEFNAMLSALRESGGSQASSTNEEEQGDLATWEATLEDSQWSIKDQGRAGLENTYTDTKDRADLITGGLLLVNQWHALPNDFSDAALVSVATASKYKMQVQDNSVRLFQDAYDALAAMVEAAEKEGLKDYIVREAYRSNQTQTEMFDAQKEKLSADYSGDILIEQTKKKVNYPGTSDYQLGLSFRMDLYPIRKDENSQQVKFQQSEEGKWFTNNAWKYGVIFRFPAADFPNSEWEDKSYKTGVSSLLNLYRYVGKAHSTAMRVMGYCLEEYVEFLQDHPHLCVYQDDTLKYEIFRIPMGETLTSYDLPVPNPASEYQASLDNLGGVVMAYTYNQ